MASAMNHKKRSHRSEKMHMASVRQMKQFSPRAGVTLPWGWACSPPLGGISWGGEEREKSRRPSNAGGSGEEVFACSGSKDLCP